jgi:tetratricopeptide (TPR) repeat protein
MTRRRCLSSVLVVWACIAGGRPAATSLSVTALLDQYAAGRFDAVVEALAADGVDFEDVLKQLRLDGPAWMDAGGPADRARRELVAATFALEAARAGAWRDWKRTQKQPLMCAEGEAAARAGCYQPPSILYWKAPPLLIEWGCELFRRDETPRPIERWWQLAALAVAERSEDTQFLTQDPAVARGLGTAEIGNVQDEIMHLEHVMPRFPKEKRFVLAQGIARDRVWPQDAVMAYGALRDDPDIGGEATMRLGAMQVRSRNLDEALKNLEHAETITRDPHVVFLARYFRGQAHAQRRRYEDAEKAYRGAVATVPNAQSATIALAALLMRDGRRAEAQQLVRDMLAADPPPPDPWRSFVHADDRFWPQLVGKLRAEIAR